MILAASGCRTAITEAFQSATSTTMAVGANLWGCETTTSASGSKYVATVTTSINGEIRVNARGFGDPLIDTYIVSLAPMIGAALATSTDGTRAVSAWRCGNTTDGTNMPAKFLPGSCKG